MTAMTVTAARTLTSELPATLTGLQQALKAGELSAGEALKVQRLRFERLDAQFHCAVQHLEEPGPANSPPAGPLSGIGLAHKDIFDTPGRQPGLGRNAGQPAPGLAGAAAPERLAQAGASVLGWLTMAEYACGATGANPHFAPCINPLHALAVVGGSSSGSAVAVASEMAYGSLGTDTAGSVRIPAATCGLLGLKTTHGLISTAGVHPLAPSLDGVGMLARSAADASELLAALVAPGRLQPARPAPRLKAWLPEAGLEASVAAALAQFAIDYGATARLTELPEHRLLSALSEIVLHSEAALTHQTGLAQGSLSAGVSAVALPGRVIPPHWYQAALRDRAGRARAFCQTHLASHDILLAPALPRPIPDASRVSPGSADFDVHELLGLHRYMGFVNYLGLPSLVIPVAQDARGLPISVQLIARPFAEATLLAFASRVERERFGSSGLTRPFLHLSN